MSEICSCKLSWYWYLVINIYSNLKSKELLIALYFLLFILGFTTGFSYSFYNEFRFLQIIVLLFLGTYGLKYKQFIITKLELLFLLFIIVGSFFLQQPEFVITELLLVYLLYKTFQTINYNNLVTKIIVLATFLLFFLFSLSLIDYLQTGSYRALWYPLPWNIRVYNSCLLIISIFTVWFYLAETKYKFVYLLYLFLAFFAVLLDGGRSVTLAYSAFMAIIALYYARERLTLIGVYLASWVAYLVVTYLATAGQDSSLRIARESSSGRLDLWQNAMSCWAEHPIIGCGFYQLNKYPHLSAHPHNLFIQVLSETGLIGFGFLLVIIYSIAKRISWDMKRNAFVIAALLAVTIDMSLSGIHIYPVTQMALLWLFVFLLKNPAFAHAKYFNQPFIQASRIQQVLSLALYTVIGAWFLYLSIQAFNFSDEMPMTPPRFWVYGYYLF